MDLITGRIALPLPGADLDPPADAPAGAAGGAGAGCGCPSGEVVPCGADAQVLVPLGAALGTTDELAELVGVGPLDPDLLRQLLLAAPELRAVWVDENGVPLATGSRTWRPHRGDPADLRAQLLALAAQTPPRPEPRDPEDHGRPGAGPPLSSSPTGPPGGATTPDAMSLCSSWFSLVQRAHPPGTPGPYRVGERLRRLLTVRRPLCEWPGCGMPARRCDMEHDLAWPAGATCGCQLGPCCRRHHRVKQTGWSKTRTATGVRWTGPTGRSWWSPSPHQPPAAPVRPLPDLPAPDPLALLSRAEWEGELDQADALLDGCGHSDRCDDLEPPDVDLLRHRLRWTGTTWTLDLADAQGWQDIPHPAHR